MDQFEYVMVLVSIIIGLGIAHQLLGLAGVVDRVAGGKNPLGLSVAYFSWLGVVFLWTVTFWWWEFRFAEFVTEWTIGLYFFLVVYAVVLFLLAAILVPQTWDGVAELDQYFLQRGAWFYSLLLLANSLDILDSYLKGGMGNLIATPPVTYAMWGSLAVAGVAGLRAKSIRVHKVLGLTVLALQVLSAFEALPKLGQLNG